MNKKRLLEVAIALAPIAYKAFEEWLKSKKG